MKMIMNHKITASKTLYHKSLDLMSLVLDVGSYCKFIPYCTGSTIVHIEESKIIADLTISFKGVSATYRSTVLYDMDLLEIKVKAYGTKWFESLDNSWFIRTIDDRTSQLDFLLAFSSESLLFNTIIDKALDNIRDIIMHAFEEEADKRYGAETYKY